MKETFGLNLTMQEYDDAALTTCMDTSRNLAYMLTGLTAEVGEINDKIAKAIRKGLISVDGNEITYHEGCNENDFVFDLMGELGDVLWFVNGLASVFGLPLAQVALENIHKLKSRKERGVIDGSGDNR